MKKIITTVILSSITTFAYAQSELAYKCKAVRHDYDKNKTTVCGSVVLDMNNNEGQPLTNCGLKIYGGSAWGSKCKGMTITLGTSDVHTPEGTHNDVSTVFYCPQTAPQDFQMSLLPSKTSFDYSLECDRLK